MANDVALKVSNRTDKIVLTVWLLHDVRVYVIETRLLVSGR